ncbi:TPA: hypothetical protein PXL93_001531 [Yersinia enterocolitica]|nr:hypothetical protein [Yersinia enterocolitica]HDL6898965.1 hypothetical protein [Yersinia enterocolitica]HDL7012324.1 hypothetical protein [Yersinia enterocolitica]HDL7479362.1 hypothetical protein [Yersinia enterocolitica]
MDESFWTAASAVVAFLALFLSQIPPIRTFLGRRKPNISTARSLSISHSLGLPNVQLYINLENVSPKPLRISNISIKIIKLGSSEIELPAFSVFDKPEQVIQTAFTPFTIKPNAEWAKNISFFIPFEGGEEQKYKEISYGIRNNLNMKRGAMNNSLPAPFEALIADEEFVEPAISLYKSNRYWVPGDYTVTLLIKTDSEKTSTTKEFTFLLNTIEIKELDTVVERYKFGNSFSQPDNNAFVFPMLRTKN